MTADPARIRSCAVCKRTVRATGPGQICPHCGGPVVILVGIRLEDGAEELTPLDETWT